MKTSTILQKSIFQFSMVLKIKEDCFFYNIHRLGKVIQMNQLDATTIY